MGKSITAGNNADMVDVVAVNAEKDEVAAFQVIFGHHTAEQGKLSGTAYNNCFEQGVLVANKLYDRLVKKMGPAKAAATEIIQIPPFAATPETVKQIDAEDRW